MLPSNNNRSNCFYFLILGTPLRLCDLCCLFVSVARQKCRLPSIFDEGLGKIEHQQFLRSRHSTRNVRTTPVWCVSSCTDCWSNHARSTGNEHQKSRSGSCSFSSSKNRKWLNYNQKNETFHSTNSVCIRLFDLCSCYWLFTKVCVCQNCFVVSFMLEPIVCERTEELERFMTTLC